MPIPPQTTQPLHDDIIDWLLALSMDLKLSKIDPQMMHRPINKLRLAEWNEYANSLAHCNGTDFQSVPELWDRKRHTVTLRFMHDFMADIEKGIDEGDPLGHLDEARIDNIIHICTQDLEKCRQQLVFY